MNYIQVIVISCTHTIHCQGKKENESICTDHLNLNPEQRGAPPHLANSHVTIYIIAIWQQIEQGHVWTYRLHIKVL